MEGKKSGDVNETSPNYFLGERKKKLKSLGGFFEILNESYDEERVFLFEHKKVSPPLPPKQP